MHPLSEDSEPTLIVVHDYHHSKPEINHYKIMGEKFYYRFYQRYLYFDKLNRYKETGMEKDEG